MALVPPDVLARSPSVAAGVDPGQEKLYRVHACTLIQEAGILLRLCVTLVFAT
jgi:hypothetical protein